MKILHRFGKMYVESGDTDQAIQIFDEGLDLARSSRSSKFEGVFLARTGDAYALTPQKQKAVEFYMQALNPLKKSKELAMVAEINQRLNRLTGVRVAKEDFIKLNHNILQIMLIQKNHGICFAFYS